MTTSISDSELYDSALPTFRIDGNLSFSGKAPIPKAPFCRPLCVVNLPSLSVNQPAPPNESTKMRNAKRIKGRGWRKMSLRQYNAMKRGELPFLGTCYQKKNH
jgi:hypothetical protein